MVEIQVWEKFSKDSDFCRVLRRKQDSRRFDKQKLLFVSGHAGFMREESEKNFIKI